LRLFVAVAPTPEVTSRIERALAALSTTHARAARWASPGSLHLTLAFLGEIAEELVPAIAAALRAVAAQHAGLSLRFRGGGSFGSPRHPRILWVPVEGDLAALSALQRGVDAALVPLGHQPDPRPFSPHLTLARSREPRGDPALAACAAALAEDDFGESRIAAIVLYRSDLGRDGARYTSLDAFPLTA